MKRPRALLLLAAAAFTAEVACAAPLRYRVWVPPVPGRSTVMQDAHYHHAPTVARYRSTIWVAWNGNLHSATEGRPGQVIMLRTSGDEGASWGPLRIPFVREYRAFDEAVHAAVDAEPGNADDDHRIRNSGARQWQPSLVVFQDRLLMFWSQDRGADGSAMMMSELEPDGQQWRSSELRWRPDGRGYAWGRTSDAKRLPRPTDPPTLDLVRRGSEPAYQRIAGFERIPLELTVVGLPAEALPADAERQPGSNRVRLPLAGRKLVPTPQHAMVTTTADGRPLLVVSVILQQTDGDWNSAALKVPATLTTTNLDDWRLDPVPLRDDRGKDFLGSPRGDVGAISAWEPSTVVNRDGAFSMLFRLNIAPRPETGKGLPGSGMRMALAIGHRDGDAGIRWQLPQPIDLDVPATRGMTAKLPSQSRWMLAHNYQVQGLAHDSAGAPHTVDMGYDPWARKNLSLFLSTRGRDDFIAGPNVSRHLDAEPDVIAHYPYLQPGVGSGGDEVLLTYSTHRRSSICFRGPLPAPPASCNDSIEFARIGALPDAELPVILPNEFARYQRLGRDRPQARSYELNGSTLTLFDRSSAGLETWGQHGCVALRFRLDGEVAAGDTRPIVSFGRGADRATTFGLDVERRGGRHRLTLAGRELVAALDPQQWTTQRICYDRRRGTLRSGSIETAPLGAINGRSHLGDVSLARRAAVLPSLLVDIDATTLDPDPAERNR